MLRSCSSALLEMHKEIFQLFSDACSSQPFCSPYLSNGNFGTRALPTYAQQQMSASPSGWAGDINNQSLSLCTGCVCPLRGEVLADVTGRSHVPTEKKGTGKIKLSPDHGDTRCRRHKSNLKQGEANGSECTDFSAASEGCVQHPEAE